MEHYRHGGDVEGLSRRLGCAEDDILDFSANINPLGPPPWLAEELRASAGRIRHYPDPTCRELTLAASARYGVDPAEVVCSNGSTELLHLLPRLARRHGLTRALAFVPCYADYLAPCRAEGLMAEALPLDPERGFAPDLDGLPAKAAETPSLVYLGQPNNPTGAAFPAARLRELARSLPGSLFVVDEAFADFVPGLDRLTKDRPANVLTLLSLTKFYAMPGLRLGLALADPGLAAELRAMIPTWSVGVPAQRVGARCLADADYFERSVAASTALRRELAASLQGLPGLTCLPGQANFLLARLDEPAWPRLNAPRLREELLSCARIAIRDCSNFEGLGPRWIRLAVRAREENAKLVDALGRLLASATATDAEQRLQNSLLDSPMRGVQGPQAPGGRVREGEEPSRSGESRGGVSPLWTPEALRPGARRTPALMVLGTSSNAGKSLLTAGLCRLLARRGLRVAPFKAQNMALNSYVTPRGEEIGRAQALQAQACGREIDARMNPILLKPTSTSGSQVVLLGRPIGVMSAREYFRRKPEFFEHVKDAYDSLAAENDAVILEGAGSPAEVNLKRHDVVNLRMAAHAGARAILVGDIDRGGVFASLIGTMACLEDWERELVGGFVLNKFRGDASLLVEALDYVTQRTGRPFLGTVPHLSGLGLPEEDSVNFKERRSGRPAGGDEIDVVCLDLPYISNFTDLDALAAEPSVGVRLVRDAAELGRPDAVIIPGSKNTLADLAWLRDKGLARAIQDFAASGGEIVGVCGGFQMLGERIEDPLGLESSPSADASSAPGLGLLPLITIFGPEKVLARTGCRHAPSGLGLRGYEIHHGRTRLSAARSGANPGVLLREDGAPVDADDLLACADASGRVWGAYLHGLFDADAFRRRFIDELRAKRGLPPLDAPLVRHDAEPGLDRLADALQEHLDMDAVLALLGL